MNVILELKNGNKYFGRIIEIDESPKIFQWIILKDKLGREQSFASSEIARVEVDE